ncbi:helix-turn-helix domain-containing protein [Rossellomorea vietnamensis]|jgi:XRE family transcriptional regulator, master regulator for biofilm formation|uniref:Helix-turn-helix domain-containing protein n=2 Tax=Rossellomorea TaxID=2837508 RepID=A0A5D4NX12_9BACI|nr:MULTISPECIES: helix-turn-helix domain-containing protein [Rossellomorea]TYS17866.1 helix-turn-helix domain-containing protein [Rossellomorea vietnamensis]TYS78440.1 helix-turn-helix domain-containing protein [Rossellomorea aquimaris]
MIGERVKKLRQERKMSMTELADKAGVAKSYLSSIERNLQKNPSVQFLEKISKALDVPVDSLLYDTVEDKHIDSDWVSIVEQAMDSGISKEQFREFIEFNKWKLNQK